MTGDLQLDRAGAYAQSKPAITVWSQEMARTHPDSPIVIAVNPGSPLASKVVRKGSRVSSNDLGICAEVLCRFSLDEAFAGYSGKYWDNDSPRFAVIHSVQTMQVMAAIKRLT